MAKKSALGLRRRCILPLCMLGGAVAPLHAQSPPACDSLFFSTNTTIVLASEVNKHDDTLTVDVAREGFYKIISLVEYNSGNDQINESFYLLVKNPDGTLQYPIFGNIADGDRRYLVVPDDSVGGSHETRREAGLFFFGRGKNDIQLHHYADISERFPQFVNCPSAPDPENCELRNGQPVILGPQSVRVSLFELALQCFDAAVSQQAATPRTVEIGGAQFQAVLAGSTFTYTLRYHNNGPFVARNVTISDTLAAELAPSAYVPRPPDFTAGQVLTWRFDSLAAGAEDSIRFSVIPPAMVDPLPFPLPGSVQLTAPGDTSLANNHDASLVYVISPPPAPKFFDLSISKRATIATAAPGTFYSYELVFRNHGPATVNEFVVHDTLPPFISLSNFSDPPELRNGNVLRWRFGPLVADSAKVLTYDATVGSIPFPAPAAIINRAGISTPNDSLLGNNVDSSRVLLQLGEECYLDRNVFQANLEPSLGINFELPAAGNLEINIHDLTGVRLVPLVQAHYNAGIHRVEWDGRDGDGKKVGSGLYVVTLRTETFTCWKKFMVVR